METKNRKIIKVTMNIEYDDGYEETGELPTNSALVLTDWVTAKKSTKHLFTAPVLNMTWNRNINHDYLYFNRLTMTYNPISEVKFELSSGFEVLPKK